MVGLEEKRKARVEELSGGQKQRLSITLALVNSPKVVFLDEPTTGLDPGARRELWQTVRDMRAAGTTVVLTTHYMEEAEVLCDRVAVMDRGKVIACDTPTALVRSLGAQATVKARIGAGALDPQALARFPGVTATISDGERIELKSTDVQATLVALLDLAARAGVTLNDLGATQASLEDVFLSLTGRTYVTEESTAPEPERRGRRGRAN